MDDFVQYILTWPVWSLPLVIYFVTASEYIFPPFPGDTLLIFCGYLAGRNIISLFSLFLSAGLGSFCGSYSLYLISLKFGRKYLQKNNFFSIPPKEMRLFEKWYKNYGNKIIAINRFIPGLRSLFFVAAGIVNISPIPVAAYSIISITLWNTLLIMVGWRLGLEWGQAKSFMRVYSTTIGVILALIVLILITLYLLKRFSRRKKDAKGEDPSCRR